MAKALFISTDDVKRKSILKGNLDVDNFIQFIEVAQDTHILSFLGTDLYNRISTDIIADTLTGDYLTLTTDFIKPMLVHWSVVESLPFLAYTADNVGITKRSSENSESVSQDDIDSLVEKARQIASNYTERFLLYICANSELFPEYSTNTEGEVKPNNETNFTGWVI